MKKTTGKILTLCILTILFIGMPKHADAAAKNVTLGQDTSVQIDLNVGDTGVFILDTTQLSNNSYGNGSVMDTQIVSAKYETTATADVFTITPEGTYTALAAKDVSITVYGYNKDGQCVYLGVYYNISIYPDMTNATLEKTTFTAYRYDNTQGALTFTDALVGVQGMNAQADNVNFSYTSSNSTMYVSCRFSNGVITVTTSSAGTTNVNLLINNKSFTITITVTKVSLKGSNGFLLAKGKTKTLKLNGISKGIQWKSSKPKVASISSKGVLKAKKNGNVIITASVGSGKIGCVVSVVSKARKKVINNGIKTGKTCTYSQAKRMQKGFYDCSSLVWKAYQAEKKTFGMKNYAPVAADVAKWCASHKKIVKGNKATNIQNMKYKPGALMFETGYNNGRYKGIYHVEMFAGYCFVGFDASGKAVVNTKWVNRPDGYYGLGDLWANV